MTTFNTIEWVALLALCPSEQKLVPASDRSKMRSSVTRWPSGRKAEPASTDSPLCISGCVA